MKNHTPSSLELIFGRRMTTEEVEIVDASIMMMVDRISDIMHDVIHKDCSEDGECAGHEHLEMRLAGCLSALSLMNGIVVGWMDHLGLKKQAVETSGLAMKSGVEEGTSNPAGFVTRHVESNHSPEVFH